MYRLCTDVLQVKRWDEQWVAIVAVGQYRRYGSADPKRNSCPTPKWSGLPKPSLHKILVVTA